MGKDEDLRKVFDMFDYDKSGEIDAQELEQVFKVMNIHVSPEQIKNLLVEVDVDGRTDMLNFFEFKQILQQTKSTRYTSRQLRKAFQLYDVDGDGYISAMDLRKSMMSVGHRMSDAEIRMMIQAADTNKDGFVSFEEFVNFLGKD
mmetsp:Transcript_17306/g.27040  ORF Transcript_17306/g.27040 Transcript_17306/m.27040 type:complete len:145 (-) Transcript_17306:75-509(-)|eukprot:CAMPEP_0201519166 /NCGR_PEP_ID=MMETSP0161_2-20130828/9789_1 /ASSEMBLY_ACC=CAM_ASM_000251 /TAXON_ID=180227 /ORGANISM="Neoparamoeba aestuarina, Strain SoJaBio B1-5/56/2" /LENGTH=144 /DNA_ID=CAMNT_0047917117 /DNA_START=129 /DNA_END=563 /DNA_ORIENTATION=+